MIKKFIKGKMIRPSGTEVQKLFAKMNLSEAAKKQLKIVAMIMSFSYISASSAALVSLSYLANSVTSNVKKSKVSAQVNLKRAPNLNYHSARLAVLGRNVFNSEGEVPEETDEEEVKEETPQTTAFDMKAKCQDPTVNVKLVGTIAMEPPENSLATVKDPGYTQVDVYRVGDEIYDKPGTKIVAIERKQIVINNNGRKECLKIDEKKLIRNDSFGEEVPDPAPVVQDIGSEDGAGARNSVVLDPTEVAEQLGEGYVKIMNAARIVPHIDNQTNNMDGFKIFAIKGKSLFSKIGLKNGDIITQVNDVSMKQPDQGYALYRALEEEREINIQVLRKGQPQSLRVSISGP